MKVVRRCRSKRPRTFMMASLHDDQMRVELVLPSKTGVNVILLTEKERIRLTK
jgi:hypothetical protein